MTKLTATHSWSGLYDLMRLFFRIQCYPIISAIQCCCTVWWSTMIKQLVLSENAATNIFYILWGSLWQITMLIMNFGHAWLPASFLNCQLLIVECYGHKAVEYGVKYNLILVSQTIFIEIYSCPSCILGTLLKNHLFLNNVIVSGSFENIYLEQCSPRPILEWRSTTFLNFQHHLKISSTAWYFHGISL